MRMILLRVSGAKSHEDLRTYQNVEYPTFKQTAIEMGLLDTDSEWINTLTEATSFMLPAVFRKFFVTILTQCQPASPFVLWDKFKNNLSEDLLQHYRHANNLPEYEIDDMIYNETLRLIDENLKAQGLSLECYEDLPSVNSVNHFAASSLLANERNYSSSSLLEELERTLPLLNADQKLAYDTITEASDVSNINCQVFFVDGPGGTGKTFLYKQLLNHIRSKGKIALAVASSGIAALLLPGGRTEHSRLKIPIKLHTASTLNLPLQSKNADLIRKAEIILWDEAPMTHRHAYQALGRSLRDIMKTVDPLLEKEVFGGKIVCFGGDFRQILPVVKKGTKSDTIDASLNMSFLWRHVKVLKLTNEPVKRYGDSIEARQFAEFLLEVGEGRAEATNENFENDTIRIPEDMLVEHNEKVVIETVYPDIKE